MKSRHLLLYSVLALHALIPAAASAAGTLCGIIRDAATLAPVARAGIFLRTPAGAYTGLNTATDLTGHFCLGDLVPGTYDIEVRVDDYRLTYRRNVVVVDDVSGVEIPVVPLPVRLAPPTPNPARAAARLVFSLTEAADVRLQVVDVQGRRVISWRTERLAAGSHTIDWDLRDGEGRAVPSGLYFVQLDALGIRLTRAISRIRG